MIWETDNISKDKGALMDVKIAVIEDDKKLNEGICLSLK